MLCASASSNGISPLLGSLYWPSSEWSSCSGVPSSSVSVRECFTGRASSLSPFEMRLRFLFAVLRGDGGGFWGLLSFSWLAVERVARAIARSDLRNELARSRRVDARVAEEDGGGDEILTAMYLRRRVNQRVQPQALLSFNSDTLFERRPKWFGEILARGLSNLST